METLKELLERGRIKREIQKQSGNKSAWFDYSPINFYIKMHLDLPSQSYGSRIQNYVCAKAGVDTVPGKEDRGDCVNAYNVYHELKVSYKSYKDCSYNFLQIRLWQDVDYLVLGIDPDDDYKTSYYYLTHEQVIEEDSLIGHNCHGTKEANKSNNKPTRKLGFVENSFTHRRWIKQYKLASFEEALSILKNSKRKIIINGKLTRRKTFPFFEQR